MDDVILAFDLQNEPLIEQIDLLNANDPDDWLCGRAGALKGLLGSSGVKVATGGVGGSQYCCDHEFNLLEKAVQCEAIDILSVHGYVTPGLGIFLQRFASRLCSSLLHPS
jgi:mannan endo-1,4-beta-mannosidase